MKRIIIIIIVSLAALLTCFLFLRKSEKATSNNTDVTSVASSMSEEDISAMISQMVEAQLAERLADETTTTVPPETESVVTTPVSQETESAVTTTVPQETEVVTTTSAENASTSAVNPNITATVSHNGYDYSMKLANSTYQAAFQSRFLSESGRETSIFFSTGNINKISVATAFADTEGLISDFGDFSEVDFTSDETGTLLSYRIPDSPFGDYKFENHINFCAVFCIETGDDQVYYTSISY